MKETYITKELNITHIPKFFISDGIYNGVGIFSDLKDKSQEKIVIVECTGEDARDFYRAMEKINMDRLMKARSYFIVDDFSYLTFSSDCGLSLNDYISDPNSKIFRTWDTTICGFSTEFIHILRDVVLGLSALQNEKFSCPVLNAESVCIFPPVGNGRRRAKLTRFSDKHKGGDWIRLGALIEWVLIEVCGTQLVEPEINDLIDNLKSGMVNRDFIFKHPALTTPSQMGVYLTRLQSWIFEKHVNVDTSSNHAYLFDNRDWRAVIDNQIFLEMSSIKTRTSNVRDFIFSLQSMFEHSEKYVKMMDPGEKHADGIVRLVKKSFPEAFLRLKTLFTI